MPQTAPLGTRLHARRNKQLPPHGLINLGRKEVELREQKGHSGEMSCLPPAQIF